MPTVTAGVDDVITPHDQYLRLAKAPELRQEAYQALFQAHLDTELVGQIRTATNGNHVLGSKRFEEEIALMLGQRVSRGKSGRPSGQSTARRDQAPPSPIRSRKSADPVRQ